MKVACALLTHLRAKVGMSLLPYLKYIAVVVVDRSPSMTGSVVVNRFPRASDFAARTCGAFRITRALAALVAPHTVDLLTLYEDQKDDMWTFHDLSDDGWYR